MNVCGIDVSTKAVDLVRLDFHSDAAVWTHYEAGKGEALVRARTLADLLPTRRSSIWDDCGLVAIERPHGLGTRQVGDMMLVGGIVVAKLPPEIPVWLLGPTEWRKECGLAGNASKDAVRGFVGEQRSRQALRTTTARIVHLPGWSQDACDAFCVAYAARAINGRAVAA